MNIKLYGTKELDDIINQAFQGRDICFDSKREYFNKIKLFVYFLKSENFNENTFFRYKEYLRQRNDLAVSTKNSYLNSARILLKEMAKIGRIPVDITLNVKSFKQNKKHKKLGINEEEIEKIKQYFNHLDSTVKSKSDSKKIIRLKAIFILLIFQGLRQIEIIRTDLEDLDLKNNTIFILGKGRDDKELVNIHPLVGELLKNYIDQYNIKSGPLFFSISNNGLNKRITTRSIRRIVKNLLLLIDIDKSTHGFRHYFTTKLLKQFNGDIMKTRKFTRHNSLEMLLVYNDEIDTKSDLKEYYESFDNLKL